MSLLQYAAGVSPLTPVTPTGYTIVQQAAAVVTTNSTTPIIVPLHSVPKQNNYLVVTVAAANSVGGTGSGPYFAPFTTVNENGGVTTWNAVREGPTAIDYASASIFWGIVGSSPVATVYIDVDTVNPGPNGYTSQQCTVYEINGITGFNTSSANDSFTPSAATQPGAIAPAGSATNLFIVCAACNTGGVSSTPPGWAIGGNPAQIVDGTATHPGVSCYLASPFSQNPTFAYNNATNAASVTMVAFAVGGGTNVAPGAVTGLFANNGNTQVGLSWGAPSGTPPFTYIITQNNVQIATTTNLNYTVTGLTNGTTYTLGVKAQNSVGTGPLSTVSGKPVAPTTATNALAVLFPGGFDNSPVSQASMNTMSSVGWGAALVGAGMGQGTRASFGPSFSSSGGGTMGAPANISGYTTSTTTGPGALMNRMQRAAGFAHAATPTRIAHLTGMPNYNNQGYFSSPLYNPATNRWSVARSWPAFLMGCWNGAQFNALPGTGGPTYTGYVDPGSIQATNGPSPPPNNSAGYPTGTSNGFTWQTWYQYCADIGDAAAFIGTDGFYLDAEDISSQVDSPNDSSTNPNTSLSNYPNWGWANASNGYGGTYSATLTPGSAGLVASLAQEQQWAFDAGIWMMYYFNNGRTDQHAANGNKYPVHIYMEINNKSANIPGGALALANKNSGNMGGTLTPAQQPETFYTMLQNSVFMWFVAGLAQNASHVYLYDATLYAPNLDGGNFPGSTLAEQFANALATDVSAMANIDQTAVTGGYGLSHVNQLNPDNPSNTGTGGVYTLPSNVSVAPILWLDGASGQQIPWTTSQWGQAVQGMQANGLQGGAYSVFQFTELCNSAGSLAENWTTTPSNWAGTSPFNFSLKGQMPPPPGYTAAQKKLDDQFSGATLNSSLWYANYGVGSQVYNNGGSLASPYSGGNTPLTTDFAIYNPSQVVVSNGLTLTAQRYSGTYANQGYTWLSGVIRTGDKYTLPTTGTKWYVQVNAWMPDTSQGMWPAVWFFPVSNAQEYDGFEGGWLPDGQAANLQGHSDLFSNNGEQQVVWPTPSSTDLSAGYNVYGFEMIFNSAVNVYFNGSLVYTVSSSTAGGIPAEAYEILIQLQVSKLTSWGHTAYNSSTPTSLMRVAEVQVYAQ